MKINKTIVLVVIINLLLAFTKYLIMVDVGVFTELFIGLIMAIILDLLMSLVIIKIIKRREKSSKIKYYQLLIISILITFIDYILIKL